MTTMTTTATDTAAPTGRRTARHLALTYAGLDLKRQLRDRMGMFFIVALECPPDDLLHRDRAENARVTAS